MGKGKKKMKLVASALAIGAGVAAVNAVRKKNYEGGQGDSPKSTEKKGMPEERKEELKQFRNTERGKYEKNSKGIYYTNGKEDQSIHYLCILFRIWTVWAIDTQSLL